MWIAWLIGLTLSSILVLIWSRCYVYNISEKKHRLPVNIIVAILYILLSLIPILNIIHVLIWIFIFLYQIDEYDYSELNFPKWMTKKIQ